MATTKQEELLNAWRARLHKMSLEELVKLKKQCQHDLFNGKAFIANNIDVSLRAAGEVNKRIEAIKAQQNGEVRETADPVTHFSKVFGVDEAQARKYISKHGNPFPVQEGVRKPLTTAADFDAEDTTDYSEPEKQVERKHRQHAWGE